MPLLANFPSPSNIGHQYYVYAKEHPADKLDLIEQFKQTYPENPTLGVHKIVTQVVINGLPCIEIGLNMSGPPLITVEFRSQSIGYGNALTLANLP
ncbi:hypothetical protein K3G63_14705 [Hymenobacter sp. HSC-4F20]|uniref:hypothetical protein n=1 Tax=Hymenobacter sp. HSC-4F20 TaxID=2864135 RepID=UPI001C73A04B|nr:hypothetical protein [Hymenobacter sp. HSC-4F20]MBX0291698.1 hypothetical protein [Hymenobacter sp. HSC-4F20]